MKITTNYTPITMARQMKNEPAQNPNFKEENGILLKPGMMHSKKLRQVYN